MHDGLGNKLSLQRDYTNRVQSIENALGQKHAVALSRFGNLLALEPVGGVPVRLEYLDDISGECEFVDWLAVSITSTQPPCTVQSSRP